MRHSAWAILVLAISMTARAGVPEPEGLADPSPAVRAGTRAALAAGGPEASEAILRGLESEDPLVAAACADLAGEAGLRAARGRVAAWVADEGAPELVVAAACRALGRLGDRRDVPALAARLPGVPEAALALASIGGDEAKAALATCRSESAPAEVHFALAMLGDSRGVTALLAGAGQPGPRGLAARRWLRQYAGTDAGSDPAAWQSWWRRESLARSLGDADWDASEAALARVLAVKAGSPAFTETLGDLLAIASDRSRPPEQRTKAVMAIGRIGLRSTGPDLLGLLKSDPEPQVRLYAAEALGRLAIPETAVDLAIYLIFDEEPFRALSMRDPNQEYYTIDSEVCKALVRMGCAGGLDFMIRQLGEDRRVRVFHEALRLLHATTGQDLGYRPDAPRDERVQAAARWREWFDEHRSGLRLEGAANFRDPAFRARVRELVDSLGQFKFLFSWRSREQLVLLGETAVPEVVEGLQSPSPHVRKACLEILSRIHAKRQRGAVAALLTDERPEIRAAAAAALAEMGPGDASDHVIAALGDESPDVRIEAARALGRVPFDRAVKALQAIVADPGSSPALVRAAWFGLAAHGYADAVDRLAEALATTDAALRATVAGWLRRLTGRDPGVEAASIAAWRAWWKVSRNGYKAPGWAGADR